jgi:putative transposase
MLLMPTKIIALDVIYHVYNRGTDKRVIFNQPSDYQRFALLLYLANSTTPVSIKDELRKGLTYSDLLQLDRDHNLVDIGAYVLMPNHFHILVKEVSEGALGQFMKKLSTGYSMYFNKKYARSGGLFEGSYKAKRVDSDEYCKYLFSYIHLNPIKLIEPKWKETGIEDKPAALKYLREYQYSSYSDYSGTERAESEIIKKSSFPEYFESLADFESQVDFWLSFSSLPEV